MRFRHCASALLISVGFVVGILVLGGTVAAQTARRNQPPLTQATRAYLDGRYDEVSALTASLSQSDPAVVALKARALIARGKYADAETLLKPAAAQQPASVAALELGLLGQKLGRSDANAVLRTVAARAADLVVAGPALHAISPFDEANDLPRNAGGRSPQGPDPN